MTQNSRCTGEIQIQIATQRQSTTKENHSDNQYSPIILIRI